jgi:hypothetical protein
MADEEPWWCDCADRKGPHVHMPNWGAKGGSLIVTALVDTGTGLEIPGSRSNDDDFVQDRHADLDPNADEARDDNR